MKAFTTWWMWLKTRAPVSRKVVHIAQRQQELDEKMVELKRRIDRLVKETQQSVDEATDRIHKGITS